MKYFLIIGIILLNFSGLKAQFDIKGQVIDINTNKGIEDVIIMVSGSTMGSKTDSNGYFILNNLMKESILIVSHVCYENSRFTVSKKNKENIFIQLNKANYVIGEINLNPKMIKKVLKNLKCDSIRKIQETPDSIFTIVESLFKYPGGLNCLDHLFLTNLYPHIKSKTIKPFGELDLNFSISENGIPINITANKEIPSEFIDILNSIFFKMPKWIPATQNGKKMAVNLTYKLRYE